MDLNLIVVCGRMASEPEIRRFDSGSRMARLLITVRSDQPHRRIDVLPVSWWDPDDAFLESPPAVGSRLWISGAVQRRFWDGENGRRSRLEIVAEHVGRRRIDPELDEDRVSTGS